jgi:hypothetical protein
MIVPERQGAPLTIWEDSMTRFDIHAVFDRNVQDAMKNVRILADAHAKSVTRALEAIHARDEAVAAEEELLKRVEEAMREVEDAYAVALTREDDVAKVMEGRS